MQRLVCGGEIKLARVFHGSWSLGQGTWHCLVLCSAALRMPEITTCEVLLLCPLSSCRGVTPLGTHCPWLALFSCRLPGVWWLWIYATAGSSTWIYQGSSAQKEMLSLVLCVPWLVWAAEWSIQEPLLTKGFGLDLLLPILDEQKQIIVSRQCWIKTELQTRLKCICLICSLQALTMFGRVTIINQKSQ